MQTNAGAHEMHFYAEELRHYGEWARALRARLPRPARVAVGVSPQSGDGGNATGIFSPRDVNSELFGSSRRLTTTLPIALTRWEIG